MRAQSFSAVCAILQGAFSIREPIQSRLRRGGKGVVTKARCRKHPGTDVTTKSHTCTLNLHRASLSHGVTLAPPVRFDDRHHTRESLDGFVHCVVGFSFVGSPPTATEAWMGNAAMHCF
jgi:hypothetical protein